MDSSLEALDTALRLFWATLGFTRDEPILVALVGLGVLLLSPRFPLVSGLLRIIAVCLLGLVGLVVFGGVV